MEPITDEKLATLKKLENIYILLKEGKRIKAPDARLKTGLDLKYWTKLLDNHMIINLSKACSKPIYMWNTSKPTIHTATKLLQEKYQSNDNIEEDKSPQIYPPTTIEDKKKWDSSWFDEDSVLNVNVTARDINMKNIGTINLLKWLMGDIENPKISSVNIGGIFKRMKGGSGEVLIESSGLVALRIFESNKSIDFSNIKKRMEDIISVCYITQGKSPAPGFGECTVIFAIPKINDTESAGVCYTQYWKMFCYEAEISMSTYEVNYQSSIYNFIYNHTNEDTYFNHHPIKFSSRKLKKTINQTKIINDVVEKEAKQLINMEKFTPPTIEQIREYCKERKNNVIPEKFLAHYESNGWMVGKTKMKDWRASVRYWESQSSATPQPRPPQLQINRELILSNLSLLTIEDLIDEIRDRGGIGNISISKNFVIDKPLY